MDLATKTPCGYNLTDGGDGHPGYSPAFETRQKLRSASLGRKLPESQIARMRESAKGRTISLEQRRKISSKLLGQTLSPETRAKMSLARMGNKFALGAKHSPQANKLKSERQKAKYAALCATDKLNIETSNSDAKIDLSTFSSGEADNMLQAVTQPEPAV